jgi:hypothetical protein
LKAVAVDTTFIVAEESNALDLLPSCIQLHLFQIVFSSLVFTLS